MSARQQQVGGDHYRRMDIQPIEFILDNAMGFAEGSIIKYVSRWRHKGGIDDLRKADHFLRLIKEAPEYMAQLQFWPRTQRGMTYDDYCHANDIRNPEKGVIMHMWLWSGNAQRSELDAAGKWLAELIELARQHHDA